MTEIWKDVPGYENLYQCNTSGEVRSLDRVITVKGGRRRCVKGVVLKQVRHTHGYSQVTLCDGSEKQVWLVHRLIATTFVPNPENLPCVNHINEDKADNRVENLEWCTVAYNNAYGDRVQRCAEKHRGLRHTEETRKRMSEAHRNLTDETRQKLSQAARGRRHSAESRRKISVYAGSRKRGADGRWCS